MTSGRKFRGLIQGTIFGCTQFVLFATYGAAARSHTLPAKTGLLKECLTKSVSSVEPSATGLLFWFGGQLVHKGKYSFQEMMESIMAILMGAMGLGQVSQSVTCLDQEGQDVS